MKIIIKKVWSDDTAELIDRLKRIKSSDVMNSEYIVFKCSGLLESRVSDSEVARNEVVERSRGKDIYLLRYIKRKGIYKLKIIMKKGLISALDTDSKLLEIRNFDLSEVIDYSNGDCLIDAPNNVHFVTPSKKHTLRFLRLSDAIYSYNALDRISFWLQDYIAQSSAVIIDTWSLSSIVLKSLQLLNLDIPFDCFHEHVKYNDKLAVSVLNKISRRINSENPILILVGISSSGEFFKALPDLIKRSNITNKMNALSIYGFNNTPNDVSTLSTLNFDLEWFDQESCEYCLTEDRKITYHIDPKFYYPRKFDEEPIRFTKFLLTKDDEKSEASEFIHRFGWDEGVLVVHKDDPNDGLMPRHHAFYIDVSTLIKNNEFIEVVKDVAGKISAFSLPDLIVLPPHNAAKNIAKLFENIWPESEFIFSHDLKEIGNAEKLIFQDAKHICFIDDVCITGSRIATYQRTLRENFGEEYLPNIKKLSWFPLVMRTQSDKDITRINDSLSGHESLWKSELFYTYKIILPDWSGEGECPWCRERELLDIHVGALWDEPTWYSKKRGELNNVNEGITKKPLFVEPFSDHKSLGAGSVLGEEGLDEMQVIFLITNGLQILRTQKGKPLGKDDLLVRYVLCWDASEKDDKSGLLSRYSEPFVQSCFFRCVQHNEWSNSIWEEGYGSLKNNIEQRKCDELIGEMILLFLDRGANINFEDKTIDTLMTICSDEATTPLMLFFQKN